VHVIRDLVQEIANGLLGTHGAYALQHVAEELRIEQEKFYRRQLMEVQSVREKQHNLKTARLNYVQLTVRGAHGVTGILAHGHVVVECKLKLEASYNKKDMEASHAKEIHRKCKDAIWKRVQFARITRDTHDFVQHGQSTAPTASLSRDVARSPADCARMLFIIPERLNLNDDQCSEDKNEIFPVIEEIPPLNPSMQEPTIALIDNSFITKNRLFEGLYNISNYKY